MIYWFSGTGNSARAARMLAARLQDGEKRMTDAMPPVGSLKNGASVGLVVPVYGWGLPRAVDRWTERLPALPEGFAERQKLYVYCVLTCGDDIGRTDQLLRDRLAAKGWPLQAVFSVPMRNTYVCLPGFDTDSREVEAAKERALPERLEHIAARIRQRQDSTKADVRPGSFAWLKTYVIRPLFNRLLTADRHFRADSRLCTRCGRCARLCPLHNIAAEADGTPRWQGDCTHCLACYHGCPHHAVSYGIFTKGKGQVRINF